MAARPRLSTPDQHRLVDALLAIETLRDRTVRNLVVSGLEDDLGARLGIQRYDIERADMLSIVNACGRHPGALHLLLRMAEFLESGSPQVDELRILVDRLEPEAMLAGDQWARLDALLGMVTCRHAERLYWLAVGPFGPPPTGGRDLVSLARDLSDVVTANGPPPLLVFVELVARDAPPHAGALRAWIDGYVHQTGTEPGVVAQLRSAATEPAPPDEAGHSYLMVQLEPFGPQPEMYLLSAWFRHDSVIKVLRRDEEPMAVDDIPREINYLLTEETEVTRDLSPDFTVELILPRALINHPIDQWSISPINFERPLGVQYPVVIRVFERLHKPALYREWRRKNDWLKQNGGRATGRAEAWHWIRQPGDVDPHQLMAQLIAKATPVVVGLAFAPPHGDELGDDEYAACVHAGIPVMVWCRDDRSAADAENEIRTLIGENDVRELPRLVHQHRQRAHYPGQSAGHLGRHLTLLWDDLDRMPGDSAGLRPPLEGAR